MPPQRRQRIEPTDDWRQLELPARAPGQRRLGILLSPRTCGRILALNRKLYGLPKPERAAREPGPMPFREARRHQYWSADTRYLDHGLGGFKVYSITIIDNFSRAVVPEELPRIFCRTRFGRVLDRAGYARFRRWRVYAERGLGGEPVAAWLYAEHLTLVFKDEPLAQYRVAYQPDKRHLKAVTEAHRSPQPPLWPRGDDEWLRVLWLPDYAARQAHEPDAHQPPLFAPAEGG